MKDKNKEESLEEALEVLIEKDNEKSPQQIYEDEHSGLTFRIPEGEKKLVQILY